ncbi:MAG: winged helix-turn-helix domain-containing protein [Anaerolineae bacterium]
MAGPMVVKSNIWLEMDGQVVLSRWRVRLLLAVQETGSITQAAKIMRIPYRRAWEKIHQSEERLGLKLVDTQVGGAGGGGATLTPACLDLIDRYTALTKGVATSLQQRFEEVF